MAWDVDTAGTLSTGLLAYWKLDESSGNIVDQTGNNDGTNINTVGFSAGKINNGADFVGSSSERFSFGATNFPSGQSARSFSCWIKVANYTNKGPILIWGDYINTPADDGKGFHWFLTQTDGKQYLGGWFNNAAGTSTSATGTGAWVNLVVTIDGSGNIAYYRNGSADGTSSFTGWATINTSTGNGYLGYGWDPNYLTGSLDEIGVWNKVLSSTEISDLYNSGTGNSFTAGGGGGATLNPTLLLMNVG